MNENLDIAENEEGNNEGDNCNAERTNANVFEKIYKSNHLELGIDIDVAEIASTLLIDLSLVSDTDMSIIRYFENTVQASTAVK